MQFLENQYYHLYNRTNSNELIFRTHDNYLYFLRKYRYHLDEFLDTIGYCLIPTHYHFLIRVRNHNSSDDSKSSDELKKWVKSYIHLMTLSHRMNWGKWEQKIHKYLINFF